MVTLQPFRGAEIARIQGDLARLRLTVFREFPYLYDGDAAYEERYLGRFAASANAFVIAAFDGAELVGAATSSPMEEHEEEFAAPLAHVGWAADQVYYCAESVLLPAYRGQGLGHRFFDAREAEALEHDRTYSVFCSVIRPPDHPARPDGYRPLDGFWRKRGYVPLKGAIAHFGWRDLGDREETDKPLQLWGRAL